MVRGMGMSFRRAGAVIACSRGYQRASAGPTKHAPPTKTRSVRRQLYWLLPGDCSPKARSRCCAMPSPAA